VEMVVEMIVEYLLERQQKPRMRPKDQATIEQIRLRIATRYGMDSPKKDVA